MSHVNKNFLAYFWFGAENTNHFLQPSYLSLDKFRFREFQICNLLCISHNNEIICIFNIIYPSFQFSNQGPPKVMASIS